jgi:hypothetical protein
MGILVLKMTIEESVGGKITEGAMEVASVVERRRHEKLHCYRRLA